MQNSSHHRSPRRAIGPLVAAMLLTVACDNLPVGFISLPEIAQHAAMYEGQVVKVKGIVRDNMQIEILGVHCFSIEEGNTQLVVVTNDNVPAIGAKVAIKARLSSLATLSGQSIGVHLEEVQRLNIIGI